MKLFSPAFVVLLALAGNAMGQESPLGNSKIRALDDSNFEADTQAASGGTSGNWFVMFYAPWCSHCKRLMPTWEELADEMHERDGEAAIIAKFDMTESTVIRNRFGGADGIVKGYPTLLFFSFQKVYEYSGDRSTKSLVEFADGGYRKFTGKDVPAVQNVFVSQLLQSPAFHAVEQWLVVAVNDLSKIMELRKAGAIILVVGGFLLGSVITSIIFVLMTPPPRGPPTSRPSGKGKKTE